MSCFPRILSHRGGKCLVHLTLKDSPFHLSSNWSSPSAGTEVIGQRVPDLHTTPQNNRVTPSIHPQPQPQRVGNTSLCSRPITLPGRRVGPHSPDLTLLSINYPLSSIFKHPLSTGSFLSFLLLNKQKEKRNPCFCFCSLLFPFLVNSSKDLFPPLSVGDWVLCKKMQFVRKDVDQASTPVNVRA